MSATSRALLAKFGMTLLFAWLTLSFFDGNTFSSVLLFSIAATALNYLVGDLYVLPNFGNMVASIGDGLMAAVFAYIVSLIFAGFRTTFGTLVLFAILVAIGEYVFHQYLRSTDKVAPNKK